MSRHRPTVDAWTHGRHLPKRFFQAIKQRGLRLTKDVLWVRITRQVLVHCKPEVSRCPIHNHWCVIDDAPISPSYRCSTSKFGIGQIAGSNCTPLGLHRIAEKIGGGLPVGAVFKSRQHIGYTWQGIPDATIAHRILWLEGLEPGFNRGGNVDTHARYIYIHGLADEPTLGRPASHGCIHLAAADLLPLYDRLPSGTLVWIEA